MPINERNSAVTIRNIDSTFPLISQPDLDGGRASWRSLSVSRTSAATERLDWNFDHPYHATRCDEAVERVVGQHRLYQRGILHDEFAGLGLRPEYLERKWSGRPAVVICEQAALLPTNFGDLGDFGSPQVFERAIERIKFVRSALGDQLGRSDIRIGLFSSLHDVVTFRGITNNFHVTLPGVAAGETDRVDFYDSSRTRKLDGTGYKALTVAGQALVERVASYLERSDAHGDKGCLDLFLSHLTRAVWKGDTNGDGVVDYAELVESLNQQLVHHIAGVRDFFLLRNEEVSQFPVDGVQHWPTFVNRFIEAGVLRLATGDASDQPVFRLSRDRSVKGKPFGYSNVYLREVSDTSVSVSIDRDPRLVPIEQLVEESREALSSQRDDGVLVVSAGIGYWLRYVVGNSLHFVDGSPNGKLWPVAEASRNGSLTLVPRELTTMPYTPLARESRLEIPHRYKGLGKDHHVGEYYRSPCAGPIKN